ncbi:MAG: ABC transporter ATP-binding protein [Lachnospiraceae bacterium]
MEKEMSQKGLLGSLLQFTDSCKGKMFFSVVCAVVGVCSGILPYVGATYVVSGLMGGVQDRGYYLTWGLVVAGGAIAKVLFMLLSTTLSHMSAFHILEELRLQVASKLIRVPMGYLTDTPSGKIKKLAIDDTEKLESPIAHMIPEVLGNILGAVAAVIYLFVVDWHMALVALISLPLGLLCYLGMMHGYQEKWSRYTKAAGEMNATIVEYVGGIEVIKAFGKSGESYQKYSDAVMENNAATTQWQKSSRWWLAGTMSILPAMLLFVLPIGLVMVQNGAITSSVMLSAAIIALSIIGPIINVASYMDQFAEAATGIRNVGAILNQPEMVRPEKYVKLTRGAIELEKVHFSYGEKEILHGIDLTLEQGKVSALVGPSGSGKSTIAKLIAGYWDVQQGSIRFMGEEIRQIPFKQLNEQVSYVAQDNFLFDMTILDNIKMGNPQASQEEVYQAAQAANCHEFIMKLPNGYLTKAGEAGEKLSGGERQRITIARAILKDAPMIILDEATAYADPENEAEIQNAILQLTRGKTLLVVAHRLGTIRNAAQIAVVEQGKIVGTGTHEELLQTCETYQTMWESYKITEEGAGV